MGNSFSFAGKIMNSTKPIVVILGATGVGKSNLAIELARKFNGEIISADSMQVYKGLDIITNKVTEQEQQLARHHFIGCIDPLKRYTVVDFQNQALPLISNLMESKKMPIVVGGTNYYIESLLWEVLIKTENNEKDLILDIEKRNVETLSSESNSESSDIDATDIENSVENIFKNPINQKSFENVDSEVLHKVLMEVDPAHAVTLHPRDKRRIIRGLQVYQQWNTCQSDLISKQKSKIGGSALGGPLRYKNSIMFWLQCDKEVLDKRVNDRVDKMLEQGLLEEMIAFHKMYNETRLKENINALYTEGIFQSIGFKEFHEYLLLSDDDRATESGQKLLKKGIDEMKLHTRQYIRRQNRWVKNRFLKTPDREVPSIYALDATDLSNWNQTVLETACHIIESKIKGTVCDISPIPIQEEDEEEKNIPGSYYCDICDKIMIGSKSWQAHLESVPHYWMS